MARPEEENPFDKARANKERLKKQARSQLVSAAARERARIGTMRTQAAADEEAIETAGSKALAAATGRQSRGIAGLGGLGSLAMDTEKQRRAARSQAAQSMADQERRAQEAEQEVTRFDIEAQPTEDDLKKERADLDTELKNIAADNKGVLGIGEDENAMVDAIEAWAEDTKPTKREWERMVQKAKSEYGVATGFNQVFRSPVYDKNGRVSGFTTFAQGPSN